MAATVDLCGLEVREKNNGEIPKCLDRSVQMIHFQRQLQLRQLEIYTKENHGSSKCQYRQATAYFTVWLNGWLRDNPYLNLRSCAE